MHTRQSAARTRVPLASSATESHAAEVGRDGRYGGAKRWMAACCSRIHVRRTIGALVADSATARADDPGALLGSFGEGLGPPQTEGATGALSQVIPFALPRARGNAQPNLALRYSSS